MKKKAQISIFVIIGVIMIALIVFFVSFDFGNDDLRMGAGDLNVDGIKEYVESCVEESSNIGVYSVASKGGFIYDYEEKVSTEYNQVAYHLKGSNEIELEKDFIEGEIERFVSNSIQFCFKDYIESNNFSQIDYNPARANVNIRKNDVIIDVIFPVSISGLDSSKSISRFNLEVPLRLGYILSAKEELIDKVKESDEIIFKDLTQFDDLEINIIPIDKSNIIYSITDFESNYRNTPLIFNFAVESSGNSAPKLDFIPDFVLELGEEFTYFITATDIDGDNLSFYSESDLISINSKTGMLTFKPLSLGDEEFELCVKDEFNLKDCKNMLVRVEENE